MRICTLRNKQVINANDCKLLGYVTDVDFEECSGCILALIVPGPARLCGFLGRDIEYIIPYKCVKCVGNDAILVDVCLEKVTNKCI